MAGSLFLIHGEQEALEALRGLALQRLEGTQVVLPEIGEVYELPPGEPARRTQTGRTDLTEALGHDWQNSYAQFVTGLKRDLAEIRDERERQKAIAAMREVLDSYTRHREARRRRGKH